jgi:hypothetical protein
VSFVFEDISMGSYLIFGGGCVLSKGSFGDVVALLHPNPIGGITSSIKDSTDDSFIGRYGSFVVNQGVGFIVVRIRHTVEVIR